MINLIHFANLLLLKFTVISNWKFIFRLYAFRLSRSDENTNTTFTTHRNYWNGNVIILTKFSSLAALKVVILTTFGAASDENFIKMMTFSFQWCWNWKQALGSTWHWNLDIHKKFVKCMLFIDNNTFAQSFSQWNIYWTFIIQTTTRWSKFQKVTINDAVKRLFTSCLCVVEFWYGLNYIAINSFNGTTPRAILPCCITRFSNHRQLHCSTISLFKLTPK